MKINYGMTGAERKTLVAAIAEILGCDAEYMKTPTYAYKVGNYIIDIDGNLNFDDNTDSEEVEQLIEALRERGFEAEAANEVDTLCISYPRNKISDGGIERLKQLLEAKGNLIKKALNVGELTVEADDEKISFPWFDTLPEPDELAAYSRFICALCEFAENHKRVTAKETVVENEKFAFRTFLLRLGFIGCDIDLKKARKVLLSRLSGSSAFKNGQRGKSAEQCLAIVPVSDDTGDIEAEMEILNDLQAHEEANVILNEEETDNEISE